jgi:hypothetical protein
MSTIKARKTKHKNHRQIAGGSSFSQFIPALFQADDVYDTTTFHTIQHGLTYYSGIKHPYNPDTVRDKHCETPGTSRSHFKQAPSRKSLKKEYKHE